MKGLKRFALLCVVAVVLFAVSASDVFAHGPGRGFGGRGGWGGGWNGPRWGGGFGPRGFSGGWYGGGFGPRGFGPRGYDGGFRGVIVGFDAFGRPIVVY